MNHPDLIQKTAMERNIWQYSILLITNKRVFIAILGAFYLTVPDITAASIGLILFISTLAGFCLELPSGYISDKIGHKEALILSRVLMIISTLSFLFADSLWLLIAGGVMLSASHAFMSGTGSAFMHETLRALGREKDYPEVIGKVSSIGFAVPIVFMVLLPFLVSFSYKAPFVIALILDVIGLITVLSLTKPPVAPQTIDEVSPTNFWQVLQEGYRLKFLSFALFSGTIAGLMMSAGVFRGPYQILLEVPVIWFGVLFGIGRALASLMIFYTGKIKSHLTIYSFLKLEIALYFGLFMTLALTDNAAVIVTVFILLNGLFWGLSKVGNSFHMEIIRNSKFKATLLSVRSQFEAIIAAISGLGLGYLIELTSYKIGFLSVAIVFVVFLLPLYLYIRHRRMTGHHTNLSV